MFASANPRVVGASGQEAPSGVAGIAEEAAALACPCWVQVSNRHVPGNGNNKGWVISEDDCAHAVSMSCSQVSRAMAAIR